MFRKALIPLFVTAAVLAAALVPLQARAGGACGGLYTVEKGDTVEGLAAMCGTTASAIYAANPGLKEPLTPGQTVLIPGPNYGTPTATRTATPTPTVTGTVPTKTPITFTVSPTVTPNITVTVAPTQGITYVYNYYYYYNYSNPNPIPETSGSYVVQAGDTFSGIAYSFGVSINDLWAANPGVDPNYLYVGQILNIPLWYQPGGSAAATSTIEPQPLSYPGTIPQNAPRATVILVNDANGDVYVSLHTTRADGTEAINEFPVNGTLDVDIPVGWIDYVAWVGGVKFTGGFKLRGEGIVTLTFKKNKVIVD